MANTDNHKLTTLRTECSRRKGAGLVNHSKQPFSVSKDKAFYSCVRNWKVELECKVVGNAGISRIVLILVPS